MAPDQQPDPIALALDVATILEGLGIPYLVGGSLASSIHGELRSTNDVDFVADVRASHLAALRQALRKECYVSDEAMRGAVQRGTSFNAIHLPTAIKVDVFIAGTDPFDAVRLRHRQRVRVRADPPGDLFLDTAEHLVLRKLERYRRGGEVSDRQWRDVLGVLRVKGSELDTARLDTWARRLGVSDLLERARGAAGGEAAP